MVLTTSVVGTWVVLRGMSFLGDALAHGVLPGIALAFIVGVHTTIGAFVAAIAMVWGINMIRSYSPLPEDTSIGVLFVGFLALAVAIMSSSSGAYVGDLNRFLFGSVTGVDSDDLRRQAIAAVISVGGVIVFYRAFLVMTFDHAQAQVLGLRPRLAHGVLLVLLAISIIASFEAVGNLLVFAFLIAPPATAVPAGAPSPAHHGCRGRGRDRVRSRRAAGQLPLRHGSRSHHGPGHRRRLHGGTHRQSDAERIRGAPRARARSSRRLLTGPIAGSGGERPFQSPDSRSRLELGPPGHEIRHHIAYDQLECFECDLREARVAVGPPRSADAPPAGPSAAPASWAR